jgi:Flp pilus assembly protein TadG
MPTYGKAQLRSNRRKPRQDQGAVAVEFALIVPILAMLLLGIVTTGYSYSHVIGLTNAVREGARFGATTDASNAATWTANVIARERSTQFDDLTSSPETAVCVQLWQQGGPSGGQLAIKCDQGNGSVSPSLTMPAATDPQHGVPSGLTTGQCVVRMIAARNFDINFVLGRVTRASDSYAVARYERMDKYPTCL